MPSKLMTKSKQRLSKQTTETVESYFQRKVGNQCKLGRNRQKALEDKTVLEVKVTRPVNGGVIAEYKEVSDLFRSHSFLITTLKMQKNS